MADMIYLIAGYAVFAITLAVFVFSLVNRQNQVQQDLEMIKQLQADDTASEG